MDSRWRPSAILDLWSAFWGHPLRVIGGLYYLSKFGWIHSNPAEAGHYITSVGKLFTPTVSSGAEGQLNQLTPDIASTSVVTLGK